MSRLFFFIGVSAFVFSMFTGCSREKNPVSDHDHGEHTRAVGCVIKLNENELVRAEKNKVTGSLSVKQRTETPAMQFYLIAEDGDLFQPTEQEYVFAWESKHPEIADIVQYQIDGRWGFRIKGFQAGNTVFIFKVLHGDHADFVSLDIPVTVTSDGGGL